MKMILFVAALVLASHQVSAMTIPACINRATGQRVPINLHAGDQNPAFSTLNGQGLPEIYINEKILPMYESSQATVDFIVEHECGHVNLGHLTMGNVGQKKTNQEELAADCWSAHTLHAMGFTAQQMQQVMVDVDKLPKDPDHPAGLVRARNAMSCFN